MIGDTYAISKSKGQINIIYSQQVNNLDWEFCANRYNIMIINYNNLYSCGLLSFVNSESYTNVLRKKNNSGLPDIIGGFLQCGKTSQLFNNKNGHKWNVSIQIFIFIGSTRCKNITMAV